MTARQVLTTVASAIAMSLIGNVAQAQTSTPSSNKQIWGCSATSGSHEYIVDQLILEDGKFDIAIYQGSPKNDSGRYRYYTGTVTINSTYKNRELVGSGRTYDSTIEVRAFGRTRSFYVRDNMYGEASGTCDVRWDMADSATRRLVRQCLAFAQRKYGDVAEVTRYGCGRDPSAEMEDIKRQN